MVAVFSTKLRRKLSRNYQGIKDDRNNSPRPKVHWGMFRTLLRCFLTFYNSLKFIQVENVTQRTLQNNLVAGAPSRFLEKVFHHYHQAEGDMRRMFRSPAGSASLRSAILETFRFCHRFQFDGRFSDEWESANAASVWLGNLWSTPVADIQKRPLSKFCGFVCKVLWKTLE